MREYKGAAQAAKELSEKVYNGYNSLYYDMDADECWVKYNTTGSWTEYRENAVIRIDLYAAAYNRIDTKTEDGVKVAIAKDIDRLERMEAYVG